ncbi:MAG: nucleotide sugar dehydrogenase [Planctomycetota bacterium]
MASETNSAAVLAERLETGRAKVAVVGMGYVGLPLAVEFANAGLEVVGIDVSEERVAQINRGESYIGDVETDELAPLVKSGKITGSLPGPVIGEADAVSICVPTPLRKSKDPDISYIVAATEVVAQYLRPGQLVVLESTTYPGTTEEVIRPRLEEHGLVVGRDIFLCFSPERVDPGNPTWHTRNTPKVVGGTTTRCAEMGAKLYSHAVDTIVPVSGTKTAEMVKLLENTFRSVNIGLVNELAIICDKLEVSVWEVIGAAATKPFGFMPFWPGPGLGGHCIPVDPHYLSWKMKSLNYHARFIELADEVNSHMPEHVVSKVSDALNGVRKAVNGSTVLVLGLAYKKNVDDLRESPALDIVGLLRRRGAQVEWADSWVADPDFGDEGVRKVDLDAEALRRADCVVVVTDHADFDPAFIVEHADVVVDTRNLTKGIVDAKIWRL